MGHGHLDSWVVLFYRRFQLCPEGIPVPLPLPLAEARSAAVQAALARREEDGPMPFRRVSCKVTEPVISPSNSFEHDNGMVSSGGSRGNTPQQGQQVGGWGEVIL